MIENAEQAQVALDRLIEQASPALAVMPTPAFIQYLDSVREVRRAIARAAFAVVS